MSRVPRILLPLRDWLTGSIRRQLIIGVALVHAVLMTIFVFDLVNRQQDFLHIQSHDQARALAEALASNSVSWVLASDVSGLEEVLRAQAGYPQLEYAMVVDRHGKVLGHIDSDKAGLYLSDALSRRMLSSQEEFEVLVDSPQLVDVAVPVVANGEHIAWARIGINQDETLAELRYITREGMAYTIAAILVGILIAVLLSRGIITGLNELFGVASQICAGERGKRVQLNRKDEVGDLGMAFNLMLDTIDEEERQKIESRQQLQQAEERYREELEQRVEARTKELTALNRELEAFSYSVSHDLRAPLRSIHGFSKILMNKYHDSLDETGQDYLQRVMRASNRMGELIDDLLVLSRVSRSELKMEAVDMADLAGQVMQELREGEEERDIDFRIDSLPVACGDKKLLGVVMQNLLGNALKFSSREECPVIQVSGREEGDRVVYTVTDNGVGFDMAYADKLFGAFQRLHTTDEFEGTGIGLATVQRILNRHGGSAWAEASLGQGASFHFVLDGWHG